MAKMKLWHSLMPVLMALLVAGCIPIPKSSNITTNDKLRTIRPLERGETILVYGENATVPKKGSMKGMVTAECAAGYGGYTIEDLVTTILELNPEPGRFSVKHLSDLRIGNLSDPRVQGKQNCIGSETGSILCRLKLSRDRVLNDRLRFYVFVKEKIETDVHLPAFLPPFGVASCGQKAILEADVWDLSTEELLGSITVSSEGEYTMAAYVFGVVTYSDVQKDAINKLAEEIIQKLAGLKAKGPKGPAR
jgi:hypothetical protein